MKLVISTDLFIQEHDFVFLCHLVKMQYQSAKNYQKTGKGTIQYITFGSDKKEEEKELIEDELEFSKNRKLVFMRYFTAHFFDFLKTNAARIIEKEIYSCDLIWPSSYNDIVKKYAKINPIVFQKGLQDVFEDIPDIETIDLLHVIDLSSQVNYEFYMSKAISILQGVDYTPSGYNEAVQFIHSGIIPGIRDIKVSDEIAIRLLDIQFNLIQLNDSEKCKSLQSDNFYYFLEEPNDELFTKVLANNRLAKAISINSSDEYDWDIINSELKLFNIFRHSSKSPLQTRSYLLHLPEALDNNLSTLIDDLCNPNDGTHYIYIICEDDFINTHIFDYWKGKATCFPLEVSFDDISKIMLIKSDHFLVNNINKIQNDGKQLLLWNSLVDKSNNNRKIMFFDTKKPRNKIIKIDSSRLWTFHPEMIENNLSKVFHSLLPEASQTNVDCEIVAAIDSNKFSDLIKIDNTIVNLDLIENILRRHFSKSIFDYRHPTNWYLFRRYYRLEYDKKKINEEFINTTSELKEIIFIKNGKYIQIPSLTDKSISYNKPIMYAILALKYWKLKGNKAIKTKQLVAIINYYFNAKKTISKRVSKLYDEIEPEKTLKQTLFYDSTAKQYPKELKLFLKNQIKVTPTHTIFLESDINNPNLKYSIAFEGFEFNNHLFEDNYNVELNKHYQSLNKK